MTVFRWRGRLAAAVALAMLAWGAACPVAHAQEAAPTAASIKADASGFPLTPQMFGARCDSTGAGSSGTDDTAAFQHAVDLAGQTGRRLHIPGGTAMCRLTAPIQIHRHIMIEGDYCQPDTLNNGKAATPGPGSWLYFDHPGKGITIDDGARSQVTGVVLADLCTIRNQPLPGGGAWSPAANDFDIFFAQDDLTIRNVMLLNPTRGVYGSGRLLIQGLHGQPMTIGLQLDATHDTATVDDVHWWPYWMDNPAIEAFTRANLSTFLLGRVDNPVFSNISTIYAHDCFRIVPGRDGPLNKFHGQNIDCDLFGNVAWLVDGTTGSTWQITNFTGQGDDQLRSRSLIAISGRDNFGTFVNTRGTLIGRDGVSLTGSGNDATFVNLRLERWGQGAPAPAVNVADGNSVTLTGSLQPAGGPAGAPVFGGGGKIYNSVSADEGGTFAQALKTSHPLVVGQYPFAKLPAPDGERGIVMCDDCLKPGERPGSGTGMPLFSNGRTWFSTAGTPAAR